MIVAWPQALSALSTALMRSGTYSGSWREAVSTARCVINYPRGLLDAALTSAPPSGQPHLDTPVLLAHGYGHNRSGWFFVDRALRQAGFTSVHSFNYNPLSHDVPEIAGQLADRVELIRTVTGAERVHVVGHSLGGIVLRWYVQELGGDETVATAITVASPHRGTYAAHAWFGRTARELQPRSWVVRRLAEGARPSPVRWVAFYSNLDGLVLPASSAKLTDPALAATNVLVKDTGHLAVLLAPGVAAAITGYLLGDAATATTPAPPAAEVA